MNTDQHLSVAQLSVSLWPLAIGQLVPAVL